MSYLTYISDKRLVELVKDVLDKGLRRKKDAQKEFYKNVIDPFGPFFEASSLGFTHEEWKEFEILRQCQKTIQNHIGSLHQKILGSVEGWEDLKTGSKAGLDLHNNKEKIIAEVKNKYSTVTGAKLRDQYDSLKELIQPKSSLYHGYTAYFVTIIPKKSERLNTTFCPSDSKTGESRPKNEKIRIIDGASFYELVTGEDEALENFHKVLPTVIEDIFKTEYGQEGFKIHGKIEFAEYFDLAYKK